MNMDMLLDTLASDVQFELMPASWAAQQHGAGRGMQVGPMCEKRMPEWTKEEDEFLRQNLSVLGLGGCADALGRTLAGVSVHYKRAGMDAPSRHGGWLTANKAAMMLGLDCHKMVSWIDHGQIPGELCAWSLTRMRRISVMRLKMWLTRPESWIYVDVAKIANPTLRRFVELAQARWGNAWWSMRAAADYHHCDTADILRQINLGRLTGVYAVNLGGRAPNQSWALWYVRRSDVLRLTIRKGKGLSTALDYWPPAADAFLLRMRAQGLTCEEIAHRMGWKRKRVEYRLKILNKQNVSVETGKE